MEQASADRFRELFEAASRAVGAVVKGQDEVVRDLLVSFLSGGHVLLEGVPGVGKTLIATAVAAVFGVEVSRIQFTPDLMPADIIGTTVYDAASGRFLVKRGPIFTDIVVADEINRAPARTQSALLEAMQERRVTIEGQSLDLGPSFFVVATQNPVEMEGTYPLPEAQLDRFMMKLRVGYPDRAAEDSLLAALRDGYRVDRLDLGGLGPVWPRGEIEPLKAAARSARIEDSILAYVADIVRATRSWAGVEVGCSPRAGLVLLAAARVRAASEGRDFVVPDDVKSLALPVLSHRILPSAEAELEGFDGASVVAQVLDGTAAPR